MTVRQEWTQMLNYLSLAVRESGIMAPVVTKDTIDRTPSSAGAYVLIVEIISPITVTLPQREQSTLAPGLYFYVGSARGPGGIRARLRRHFEKTKKLHWHIDRLTVRATHVAALAVEGGDECALGRALLDSGRYQIAMPGFGSSDCRTCDSHLLHAR